MTGTQRVEGTKLLSVEGLRTEIRQRHATVRAIDGVSFSVAQGETVGLVGESGSGKTMTGLSIIGLLPPGGHVVGGRILFLGKDLARLSARGMRALRGSDIGVVFQDPMTSLNPCMTIGDQIVEPIRVHRELDKKAARQRACELLDLVGVPQARERVKEYPHQLSGGLRQRVMIAIALSCDPKLLIADEPTTALDVTIQSEILELLGRLKSALSMSMLLITHDLGVIAGHADRVMVMYAGRIVEEANASELFAQTRHPYTRALLASIPEVDEKTDRVLYSIPGAPPGLSKDRHGCAFAPRCDRATSRCEVDDPVLEGPTDHRAACFNPLETAEDARPLKLGGIGVHRRAAHPAGADERAPLLVVDHVMKEYPVMTGVLRRRIGTVHAVSDVSFTMKQGETFGLVGESGCGKTTLGKMIVALERPDAGSIIFNGLDLMQQSKRTIRAMRRNFQLIFQDPYSSLDPRMRVGPALREPMVINGIGNGLSRDQRIAELLGEVGLSRDVVRYYPHEFSGGQRQRIGFARALTLSPRLIVADEPVSALDVSIRSQLLNLMKRLQETHELTYLVISHDLSVVRYLADRIGVMYLGKLVEIGTCESVYGQPAHPYTAGLLAAVPIPDPARERAKRRIPVAGELPSARNPPSGCRFRTRCPRAQERCTVEEPVLQAMSGVDHQAACHFPLVAARVGNGQGA